MRRILPYALLLLALAALLRIDFYFSIVYLLAAVYLLARLWMREAGGRLRFARHGTTRAFVGQQVTVEVEVHNTSRLPLPWVEVRESLPVALTSPPFRHQVLSLGAGEKATFRYMLDCRQRGYHRLGPLQAILGDPLGLEVRRLTHEARDTVIVYPRVVPLARLGLPSRAPLAVLRTPVPLFEDTTRLTGVRPYRVGDSLRRMHWSASARTGALQVKLFQPAIARETLICLDLDRGNYDPQHFYDAIELAIVSAASIATHIVVRERLAVGLATQALDPLTQQVERFALPPRRERAALIAMLEVLARAQLCTGTHLPDFLQQETAHLSWGSTVAVITGRPNEALFDTLVQLRTGGFAVTLLLIQQGKVVPELQARAALLHIPIFSIWQERDLEEGR